MYAGFDEAKNDLAAGRIDAIEVWGDGSTWSVWFSYGPLPSNARFLGAPMGTCTTPIFRRKFETLKDAMAVVNHLVGEPPVVGSVKVRVCRPAENEPFEAVIKLSEIEAALA